MQTRTIKLNEGKENEKDFTFICAYRSNRSGFVHECELKIGAQTFESKCQYYNRTWERYTYQTVMFSALSYYKDYIVSRLKEDFLDLKGYKKMTSKIKPEFEKLLAENPIMKEIAEVRKELDQNNTWW